MPRQDGACFKFMYCLYAKTAIGSYYFGRDIRAAREKHPEGHSKADPVEFGHLRITPIPYALDNYCYMIQDMSDNTTVLLDVGDAPTVRNALGDGVVPAALLTTHKHWDHCDGNKEMRGYFPTLQVVGSREDSPSGVNTYIQWGSELVFGNLRFTPTLTPGHTTGHTVYTLDGSPFGAPKLLFSGDLLFIGGFGRMFEATPGDMRQSLDFVLSLPDDTVLFPGHEYSLNNLAFAAHILPDKTQAQAKLDWVTARREEKLATIPTTLGEEKTFNPSLRLGFDPELMSVLGFGTPPTLSPETLTEGLVRLRKAKDDWKYIG